MYDNLYGTNYRPMWDYGLNFINTVMHDQYGLFIDGYYVPSPHMALLRLPQPYKMISIIKLGLVPALAVIAVVGAIRGPIAGFVSGFVGTFMYDLVIRGTIVTMGLTPASYGILGFVVGLASYSFENGRSLLKLSILSAVGLVLAVLVIVLMGLTVEGYATLVAIAYVLLPLLTTGLPSVLFLTPLFARLWFEFAKRFVPSALNS